jgi:hypothetical protein
MDQHEALSYMRDKRALLSNPGLLLNDIYYSTHNTSVQDAEVTYNTGRYTQSLSNLNFGAQSQIQVPVSSLLADTYLYLRINQVGPNAAYNQNIAIIDGFGYAAINSISYLLGSSNVSQFQVNGPTLLMMNLEQCETSDKRTSVFQLGGTQIKGQYIGNTTAMGLVPGSGPGIASATPGVVPAMEAYVLLNYPWSRMTACGKLPIDTTLMSNSITLTVQFAPISAIVAYPSGAGGVAAYNLYSQSKLAFDAATVILRQGEMRDKALSLRDKLMVDKSLSYNYPFLHYQSFNPPDFTVAGVTTFAYCTSPSQTTIVLQSFINADLIGLIFYFVNVGDLTNGNDTTSSGALAGGAGLNNPFLMTQMRDLQVLFNGQVYYNSPGVSYQLYNIRDQPGSSAIGYTSLSAANVNAAVTPSASPISQYMYRVDFGRKKGVQFEDNYQNTQRIANQVLNVTFQAPPTVAGANVTYRMYCTYIYNGVASLTDGQSKIYFD